MVSGPTTADTEAVIMATVLLQDQHLYSRGVYLSHCPRGEDLLGVSLFCQLNDSLLSFLGGSLIILSAFFLATLPLKLRLRAWTPWSSIELFRLQGGALLFLLLMHCLAYTGIKSPSLVLLEFPWFALVPRSSSGGISRNSLLYAPELVFNY